MKKIGPWTQKSTKIVYQNRWLSVREDQIIHPNGDEGIYSVIDTNPAVFIVAMNIDKEILLNKQFRYTTGQNTWEIPAGSTDGGDKLESAKRELEEESGYISKNIIQIGEFQSSNGISSEIGYTYLATELEFTGNSKTEEEAISKVEFYTIDKIKEMIKSGELNDALSLAGIMQALNHLNF
jgi:8-oxo-dGTP pyrophosphatase MutT (NUDIX family)